MGVLGWSANQKLAGLTTTCDPLDQPMNCTSASPAPITGAIAAAAASMAALQGVMIVLVPGAVRAMVVKPTL